MKPLTVFVGKGNSGKSYLATLIYAIHEELGGFPRLPFSKPRFGIMEPQAPELGNMPMQASFEELKSILVSNAQGWYLSDYPADIQNTLFSSESQRDRFCNNLVQSIAMTFNTSDIENLRRSSRTSKELYLNFGYSENAHDNWNLEISHNKFKTNWNVSLSDKIFIARESAIATYEMLSSTEVESEISEAGIYYYKHLLSEFLKMLSFPDSNSYNHAYYLPAVRGGIMQSYKFVTSAAVSTLWKVGLKEPQTIFGLPRVSAEFIEKLLAAGNEVSGTVRKNKVQHSKKTDALESVARKLEKSVIGGEIGINKRVDLGYPEFQFIPEGLEDKLALNQSSSMVGELAPIVLLIRHLIKPFDLIIVEEPEAHLHASAQVAIAECLALLVRNKVKVLITTHSEWFLRYLQGLIFQGELKELQNRTGQVSENTYLHQDEVGVWEFTAGKDKEGTKVRKIEFRHETGIELDDLDDLDLDLYNKVASARDKIASEKANYTPKNIGNRLSIKASRVRKELKKLGIKPGRGGRYTFKKSEYDKLTKLIKNNIR